MGLCWYTCMCCVHLSNGIRMVKVFVVMKMYGLCTISGNSILELICMCMRSFFVLKAPSPQNSEHVLNLLTVRNKHSWGWLCVSQKQHLELKFLY